MKSKEHLKKHRLINKKNNIDRNPIKKPFENNKIYVFALVFIFIIIFIFTHSIIYKNKKEKLNENNFKNKIEKLDENNSKNNIIINDRDQ